MSPEQISKLQHLSRLFEEGIAGPNQIRELSELLSTINHNQEIPELNQPVQLAGYKPHLPLTR